MVPTQEDPSLKKEKKAGYSLAGSLSLFIHLGIFLLIGGTVIIEQVIPKQPMTAGVDVTQAAVETPPEDTPEDTPQDVPQPTDETQAASSATEASPFDMSTVTVDAPSPNFNVSLGTVTGTPGLPGTGSTGSGTGTSGGGARKKVTFLGIESNAETVGFYLDFSGTMDGERKKKLLSEMDKTLNDLPDGMPVLIINWAGPAWSLNQQATEVEKIWKRTTASDWSVEASKMTPPRTFILTAAVRKQIIQLLGRTVQAPGGTDWRSPFILASKAETPPDVIYFMTDGQFGADSSMVNGINAALRNTKLADPVINVVGLSPAAEEGKALRNLASRHKGKYTEIK